jgi:hypothetical protein
MSKGKYDLTLTDDEGDAPQAAPAPAPKVQSAPIPAAPSSQTTTQPSPPAEPTTIPDPPPKQKTPCSEAQLRALEAGRKKKQEMMAARKAPPPPPQEEEEEYESEPEAEEYEPAPRAPPRARRPASLSYQQLYYKAKLDRLMQAEQQQQQLAQYQQAPMEKHMEDIARNTIRKKLQDDVKRRAYVSLFGSEPPALF